VLIRPLREDNSGKLLQADPGRLGDLGCRVVSQGLVKPVVPSFTDKIVGRETAEEGGTFAEDAEIFQRHG
jgi:hypothetical protein